MVLRVERLITFPYGLAVSSQIDTEKKIEHRHCQQFHRQRNKREKGHPKSRNAQVHCHPCPIRDLRAASKLTQHSFTLNPMYDGDSHVRQVRLFRQGPFWLRVPAVAGAAPFERYNIAPAQNILAIRTSSETGIPEWALLHWRLVPSWSKESKTEHLLINARAEGIETKPSFRGPVRHRRCIVTASGFYEWLRHESRMCDCLAEHPNLDHPFPCLAGAHQVGIFF